MCSNEFSSFLKNLHLLVLPSTLWGVHVDPKQEFFAIVHVNIAREKIGVDKGVLVTPNNLSIKTSVYLNDEIAQLPVASSNMESISDLNSLIYNLHNIKFCANPNTSAKCEKYVLNAASSLCEFCSFEVFSKIMNDVTEETTYLDALESDNNGNGELKQEKDRHLCTVCGKTFTCLSGLEQHMLIHVPPDDKPFKCKVCAKAFAKKYNLNVHSRVHSGERPYICSTCGKTYSTRSNLSTHMNSAHCEEKRHRCELCEMTFVHPRMLRIHMRKHTGEKPFMCQTCGKVFSKNIHLTIHMRTHTGEKPYICSMCGKGFTTTGNLNQHKRINHKG